MLQINNHTPFVTELHPCEDLHGRDYAVVIIKGTFNPCLNRLAVMLADEQAPIQHADKYDGELGRSSIRYGSDLALVKNATDVIMVGNAYAPEGRATGKFDVSLSVGEHTSSVRIIGDRQWQKTSLGWQITQPLPVEQIALCYENSYGGVDLRVQLKENLTPECSTFNPIGKGFFPIDGKPVEGQLLPNIENPNNLITSLSSRPKPAGFGAIPRDWQPRLASAGTYNDEWKQHRMPLLPLDFDPRFFNAAHPDLTISPLLSGDELVTISHVTESGLFSFLLPNLHFLVSASIQKQKTEFVPYLDTLIIEPDKNRIMLTWRVAIPCKRKLLYLDSVTIKSRRSNV